MVFSELFFSRGIRRFISTGWYIASADAFSMLAGAMFIISVARAEGPVTLGTFSFALALAGVAQTLCDAGFDITLPRSIAADTSRADAELHRAVVTKYLLCAIVIPVTLAVSMVRDMNALPLSLVLLADVIPSTIGYAYICALRGLHRSNEASLIGGAYNGIPYLVAVPLVWAHVPVVTCAALLLAADIMKVMHLRRRFAYAVSSSHAAQVPIVRISPYQALRETWRDQLSLTGINVISSLFVRLPVLMLGWYSTGSEIGFYSAASRFTTAARIVPGAFLQTILPQYAERTEHAPRIRNVLGTTTLVALAIGSILGLGAPLLMHFTFQFAASVVTLQVLSAAFVMLSVKTVFEAFLLATRHEKHLTVALLVIVCAAIPTYAMAGTTAVQAAWINVGVETAACLCFMVMLARWSRSEKAQTPCVKKES